MDAEHHQLKSKLHLTTDEVDGFQEACHVHLIERQKTDDAIELLKLFKNYVGNGQTTPTQQPTDKV